MASLTLRLVVSRLQSVRMRVTEPNPAGGTFATNYTYTPANQLTGVSMTRGNVTQTRTFLYSGTDLVSATNPENGTVTYTYDGAHHVLSRTDAIGNQTQYTYDSYGRLTEAQYFPKSASGYEDFTQRVTYSYDSGPYGLGRLTGVAFGGGIEDYPIYSHWYTYSYAYNQAGHVTTQTASVQVATTENNFWMSIQPVSPAVATLTTNYQWDDEGRMTSLSPALSLPTSWPNSASFPAMGYQYDVNGRLNTLTSNGSNFATASYTPAGQLYQLSYGGLTETNTYNSMLQLINRSVPGYLNMTYNYSGTQNNGRIVTAQDGITGESTSYTYDALNRLAGASNSLWSGTYAYDGFGNLLSKSGSGGSPNSFPSMTASYNANNQLTTASYDANGNTSSFNGYYYGYTVENRRNSQTGTAFPWPETLYGNDPWGKRVMKETNPDPSDYEGDYNPLWEFYFYAINGQRLVTVDCNNPNANYQPNCWVVGENVYFGKRLLVSNGVYVATDRLGTVRANTQGESFAYYPFGEERTNRPDGRDKFATYFRDGVGQDYAEQRYYNAGMGRFWTVDSGGMATADASNPTSWNRYAYVGGDPINFRDPTGLDPNCGPGMSWDGEGCIQGTTLNGTAGTADCWTLFGLDGCEDGTGGGDTGCYGSGEGFLEQPDPGCPTGGGGGGSSGPAAAPPPDCNQILTNDITSYLNSYDGGKSPLDTNANIQALVSAGMTYDVDPRFIVALAVAESSAGINLTWGPYNAWNIRARSPNYTGPGKKPPYTSWEQAINAVNDLISGGQYFGAGLTTTSTIYPLYQGPGYEQGLNNINTSAAVGPGAIAEAFTPATLYHFTSTEAASGIAASGTIYPGAGLFGWGVYGSAFNSAAAANLMGAASTEAVVPFASGLGTVPSAWGPIVIPGAYRTITPISIFGGVPIP